MTDIVVKAKNVSKKFKIYDKNWKRLIEWATFGKVNAHRDFMAINNISFELKKGECLGIVGPNGAGKSTLLKVLTGSLWHSEGDFEINGKVASLLELGAGFHPELTGLQNIFHSSSLLGFPDDYVKKRLDDIIDFAEIGEFINQPVRTYSSGMYVRLAFSLFANLDPDIYIVDEALSVGDIFFQQKCFSRLREMIGNGTTIIFVSHDFEAIRSLCSKVIVLNAGEIQYVGNPIQAIHYYHAQERKIKKEYNSRMNFKIEKDELMINNNTLINIKEFQKSAYLRPENSDFCEKQVEILGIQILDQNQNKRNVFEWKEEFYVRTLIGVNKDQSNISNGILIFDRLGNLVWGSGTINLGMNLAPKKAGDIFISELSIKLNLHPGKYVLTVGVSSPDIENKGQTGTIHDRFEQFCSIEIQDFVLSPNTAVPFFGVCPLPIESKIITEGD